MMTTIKFRAKKEDKRKAERYLAICGMDLQTALRCLVYKIVSSGGLPFKTTSCDVEICPNRSEFKMPADDNIDYDSPEDRRNEILEKRGQK